MLLTPEHSIELQNSIGADIIMQLDDVVHVLTKGARVEEAMWRSVRWLDRYLAISSHTHYTTVTIEALLLTRDQISRTCLLSFKED